MVVRINMVLPFFPEFPGGGCKVIYEYANRLAQRGHKVIVYHAETTPWMRYDYPLMIRRIRSNLKKIGPRPTWFPLQDQIECRIIPRVINRYVDNADIIISTWWATAFEIFELGPEKGSKMNLVQDYEVWTGHEDLVLKSYNLKMQHIVIARHLQDKLQSVSGIQPVHIPNAIDGSKFHISTGIGERSAASVCMLYSQEERKGTQYGLAALLEVKKAFPGLSVDLFGVAKPIELLPDWIAFHHRPVNLAEIYNRNAIFITPSLGEGWALPPAEAMRCGCALVCTDIGGHRDYAEEGQTALLVEPRNTLAMAARLSGLIADPSRRVALAKAGHLKICEFTWENSTRMMEEVCLRLCDRVSE